MSEREQESTEPENTAQTGATTEAVPAQEGRDAGETTAKLRREAANYRMRLRDAEAERDGLAERLRVLQRGEAERVAASDLEGYRPLNDGADLWRSDGVELEALLDGQGNIDAAKVREAASRVAEEHPHWARPGPAGDVDAGKGAGPQMKPQSPFAASLKKAAGG